MVQITNNAGKVRAHGDGLKGALAGKPSEFRVNTYDAGAGELDISIDGPCQLKLECFGNEDGTYRVEYNPKVCGKYKISIRFEDAHIPGSPYEFRIVGTEDEISKLLADSSKCIVTTESAMNKANLNKTNNFSVDAGKAGRGCIMVGIVGPSVPAKEIAVKHLGNNLYSVNYTLEKKGSYILNVLWGDNHIPGSPFNVNA